MKRFLLLISISIFLSVPCYANHIKGGFFSYRYLGPGVVNPTYLQYRVTLTVYMICTPTQAQLNNPINFTVYDAGTNNLFQNVSVSITSQYTLNKSYDEPCITGDQSGCYYYIVVLDLPSIELPPTTGGYTISYQRCCRIAGIQNLTAPSASIGNTFTITIPGTSLNAQTNSSPIFLINDTAVVCGNSYFKYSFQASDIDGDSLSYSFCDAYQGGDANVNSAPPTASPPPYSSVPYQSPYNGSQPMGSGVTINPKTGLISGIAPASTGEYVVCVCVNEFRNGILIGITRKELHVRVGDCNIPRAVLDPQYITCDGYSLTFSNRGDQTLVNTYFWDFGVTTSINDTSTLATPAFTYPDTGIYILKLVTNRNQQCSDSTTAIVKIYPGFFPAFTSSGACFTNPFQFTDNTSTAYGVVNSWNWNFGDPSSSADTSSLQNPVWIYPAAGPKDVTLIVSNSKGCIKTITQTVNVIDKPSITLAFKDTLICVPDAVQLNANGNGIFSWSPTTNMINSNTASPTVNPTSTTWYTVNLDDSGCKNRDSVKVRVVSFVSLTARPDTTICLTDGVQLGAVTDGLQFQWTPAATLNNPAIVNPIATPITTTVYRLSARIGSCSATDDVKVTTVPYPYSNAGNDTTICYNTAAQLNGSYTGISFSWSPVNHLNNPNIINPIATPVRTTPYVLTIYDTIGCPKPGRDTVIVTVLPKVKAFAGRDTSVVVGQELQFNGSGGVSYVWSPPTGLSNLLISNPIGIYSSEIDSVRYKLVVTDQAGCADSAFILVKVFKTNPYIFVPSAFTPNDDGLNDVIRPIAVGIKQIKYFSIYNRWGQMVFTTTMNGKGWDGKIAGKPQNSGVFVWMVSAIDYIGKSIYLKGTVTLIR
jgi:gliding motility-associated-like protein